MVGDSTVSFIFNFNFSTVDILLLKLPNTTATGGLSYMCTSKASHTIQGRISPCNIKKPVAKDTDSHCIHAFVCIGAPEGTPQDLTNQLTQSDPNPFKTTPARQKQHINIKVK